MSSDALRKSGKAVGVIGLLVVALGVLSNNFLDGGIAGLFGSVPEASALSDDVDGDFDGLDDELLAADDGADSLLEVSAAEAAATPVPASLAPDWNLLFERLMERDKQLEAVDAQVTQEQTEEGSQPDDTELRLARLELRGILHDGSRGVALVDGRLLRIGDEIPGSPFLIRDIRRDRVDVGVFGQREGHILMLQPMDTGAGADGAEGGADSGSGEDQAPSSSGSEGGSS